MMNAILGFIIGWLVYEACGGHTTGMLDFLGRLAVYVALGASTMAVWLFVQSGRDNRKGKR